MKISWWMLSAKNMRVCNLKSMIQLKHESNDKVCAGIEFACVYAKIV